MMGVRVRVRWGWWWWQFCCCCCQTVDAMLFLLLLPIWLLLLLLFLACIYVHKISNIIRYMCFWANSFNITTSWLDSVTACSQQQYFGHIYHTHTCTRERERDRCLLPTTLIHAWRGVVWVFIFFHVRCLCSAFQTFIKSCFVTPNNGLKNMELRYHKCNACNTAYYLLYTNAHASSLNNSIFTFSDEADAIGTYAHIPTLIKKFVENKI